jgi:hypothetical protein
VAAGAKRENPRRSRVFMAVARTVRAGALRVYSGMERRTRRMAVRAPMGRLM